MLLPVPKEQLDARTREYLSRLREGCVLLASEALQDPNFIASVVLICAYNDNGALGFVMNRPSHMPLSEVFEVDAPLRNQRRKIHIGGPVQEETLQILQISNVPKDTAYRVAPQVNLSGEWDSLDEILAADPNTTRLFLGYSGWAPGQIEMEIIHDAWEVYSVDLQTLLTSPDELMIGEAGKIRNFLKKIVVTD
jgi:putative transcriptional regulator